MRIFAVAVRETGVEEIAHIAPPPRPRGRLLPLRGATPIKEAILARPTFFEHFDGVCVDWRYLHERERAAIEKESGWLKRQSLRLMVDLSSGVNLYPDLRLIDNDHANYEASMAVITDVLAKMEILGARDLILPLHRYPENNFTSEQTRDSFVATLKALSTRAANHGVTLHLRVGFGKPPWGLGEAVDLLAKVGVPNVKLAPATALLEGKAPSAEQAARLKDQVGLWLVAAPQHDVTGRLWDAHAPVHSTSVHDSLKAWLPIAPQAPLISDAILADADAEYLEAIQLEKFASSLGRSARR